MESFLSVLTNVSIMLVYMFCGFILVRARKAFSEHAASVSAILVYICSPCLIISSFQKIDGNGVSNRDMVLFFFSSLVIQILYFLILFLIFKRKYKDPKYRILTAGAVFGNCGFFGYPLVTGLFPDHPVAGVYSTLFVVSMNLLVFTLGVWLITKDKKYISLKAAVINPTVLGGIVALPLYLFHIKLPAAAGNAVSLLGSMTAPLCMFLLGMRLASMSLKEVFNVPFAYVASAFKLIIFPLFAYLCVLAVPEADRVFKITMAVLCATPSASVVLGLSELHGCEQKLCANVILVSTVFCLFTLPLIVLLIA